MSQPKIIIGTGTGRCGTTSFARLLNRQEGARVTHERFNHHVTFPPDHYYHDRLMDDLIDDTLYYNIVGDVALQWIWYTHDLMKDSDLKMIYLYRPQEEVRESFKRKTAKNQVKPNIWHWDLYKGNKWRWHNAFPNFFEDGLNKFIELSHATAAKMQDQYPDRFRIVKMNDILNDLNFQNKILKWIGIPNVKTQRVAANQTVKK